MKKTKKETRKQQDFYSIITISQGREALVGSLLLCESALHATKPPKPTSIIVGLISDVCQDKIMQAMKSE
jgi:hypothetical protein